MKGLHRFFVFLWVYLFPPKEDPIAKYRRKTAEIANQKKRKSDFQTQTGHLESAIRSLNQIDPDFANVSLQVTGLSLLLQAVHETDKTRHMEGMPLAMEMSDRQLAIALIMCDPRFEELYIPSHRIVRRDVQLALEHVKPQLESQLKELSNIGLRTTPRYAYLQKSER